MYNVGGVIKTSDDYFWFQESLVWIQCWNTIFTFGLSGSQCHIWEHFTFQYKKMFFLWSSRREPVWHCCRTSKQSPPYCQIYSWNFWESDFLVINMKVIDSKTFWCLMWGWTSRLLKHFNMCSTLYTSHQCHPLGVTKCFIKSLFLDWG